MRAALAAALAATVVCVLSALSAQDELRVPLERTRILEKPPAAAAAREATLLDDAPQGVKPRAGDGWFFVLRRPPAAERDENAPVEKGDRAGMLLAGRDGMRLCFDTDGDLDLRDEKPLEGRAVRVAGRDCVLFRVTGVVRDPREKAGGFAVFVAAPKEEPESVLIMPAAAVCGRLAVAGREVEVGLLRAEPAAEASERALLLFDADGDGRFGQAEHALLPGGRLFWGETCFLPEVREKDGELRLVFRRPEPPKGAKRLKSTLTLEQDGATCLPRDGVLLLPGGRLKPGARLSGSRAGADGAEWLMIRTVAKAVEAKDGDALEFGPVKLRLSAEAADGGLLLKGRIEAADGGAIEMFRDGLYAPTVRLEIRNSAGEVVRSVALTPDVSGVCTYRRRATAAPFTAVLRLPEGCPFRADADVVESGR